MAYARYACHGLWQANASVDISRYVCSRGKRAIIAQAAAHNAFGSGKKYTVSERTSEPAADRPIPPIELSRGLVAIGLVLPGRNVSESGAITLPGYISEMDNFRQSLWIVMRKISSLYTLGSKAGILSMRDGGSKE
ncbi:hypothetical protein ALC56_02009 [Trachymyrmex septentrionalis]|uniref:Uncharacterized protein n=1 Tax=Trachymyrmex septentrionalis TaxID=34720 RepID=A0A195FTY0_9HYME|nr:hypothetical protein ALC56_02009 [Trachymyrmex septentrionalis]